MTGEAGAGKTEASKLSLQYLAAVTGNAKEFHNIKYQLLQSNSVLEGNIFDFIFKTCFKSFLKNLLKVSAE